MPPFFLHPYSVFFATSITVPFFPVGCLSFVYSFSTSVYVITADSPPVLWIPAQITDNIQFELVLGRVRSIRSPSSWSFQKHMSVESLYHLLVRSRNTYHCIIGVLH